MDLINGALHRRQPKAIGKRRRLIAEGLAEAMETPFARLTRRMNDATEPPRYRDQLAAILLPFTAPRHLPQKVPMASFEMSSAQLTDLLMREEAYARERGDVATVAQITGKPQLAVSNDRQS